MSLKHSLSDTLIMTKRVIRYSLRSIDTIITTLAMPIMMMFAFIYIFGSAMAMPQRAYVNFIVPGVLLMCIGMGISYSAIRVNLDLTRGVFDRFHSLPIAKSSILGGHVLASLLLNAASLLAIFVVALPLGFRPQASSLQWLLAVLLLLFLILALTWMAIAFGLMAKSYEGAGVFSYLLLGLMFVSSAFVPTNNMATGLRAFAEHQPMTPLAEALRSLFAGQLNAGALITALLWCLGVALVFYVVSLAVYRRREG